MAGPGELIRPCSRSHRLPPMVGPGALSRSSSFASVTLAPREMSISRPSRRFVAHVLGWPAAGEADACASARRDTCARRLSPLCSFLSLGASSCSSLHPASYSSCHVSVLMEYSCRRSCPWARTASISQNQTCLSLWCCSGLRAASVWSTLLPIASSTTSGLARGTAL